MLLVAHADGAGLGLGLSRALMTDGSESPAVSDVQVGDFRSPRWQSIAGAETIRPVGLRG